MKKKQFCAGQTKLASSFFGPIRDGYGICRVQLGKSSPITKTHPRCRLKPEDWVAKEPVAVIVEYLLALTPLLAFRLLIFELAEIESL